MSRLPHNRAICSGDVYRNHPTYGVNWKRSSAEKAAIKKQKKVKNKAEIKAVFKRIKGWSFDFLTKISSENKSFVWREAAKRALQQRHNQSPRNGGKAHRNKGTGLREADGQFVPEHSGKAHTTKKPGNDVNVLFNATEITRECRGDETPASAGPTTICPFACHGMQDDSLQRGRVDYFPDKSYAQCTGRKLDVRKGDPSN